jgi:pimeloyl-ACP methyl ester carboxylesterase
MPVYVWHGAQDKIVPVGQGQVMAKALPNARAKFYPNDGHVSLMANHYEELLSAIVC